jgi:hypothetical protein
LRPTPAGVRHLWAHQADIIRAYHEVPTKAADVALELPTGAGKTLVGLLLAEFHRRADQTRTIYVCPTTQLATQAQRRASEYGIKSVQLTGSKHDYPSGDVHEYVRASAIAITNYQSIFNISPGLSDGQILVLDDAHAAEGPVAAAWTVSAVRGTKLYSALLDTLRVALPRFLTERLADDSADPVQRGQVEVCGPHDLAPIAEILREVLTVHAEDSSVFPARMIEAHLPFCMAYVSWREIGIRPFIAPTRWHQPFSGARRRIYMSATLGLAGELERSFGVRKIHRLPVPPGWEDQGSGRRFFLFPSATLERDEEDHLIQEAIVEAGRALVLGPSQYEVDEFIEHCVPANAALKTAADLKHNDPFGKKRPTVLSLANRYDGIDLPDEACRLIVLTGLPSRSHLQERFLWERLGAKRVLSERIRTRLTQGAGRCTRNAQDFAAVIVRGNAVTDFLSRHENTTSMQRELQAEIQFGMDNSEVENGTFLLLLKSFLAQDENWRRADDDISGRVPGLQKLVPPDAERLADAAAHEVDCWQAVWHGDVEEAIVAARSAADQLEGGSEIRSYQCFWLYVAASLALASATSNTERANASAMRDEALACSKKIAWRPTFAADDAEVLHEGTANQRSINAALTLSTLGRRGTKFERHLQHVLELLEDETAARFEAGLVALGSLLGFEAVRPKGEAAPDGAWRDQDNQLFFEAKTDESPHTPVSPTAVRQSLSHEDWMRSNESWPEGPHAYAFLISSHTRATPAAKSIARALFHVPQSLILELGTEAISALRSVRPLSTGLSDEALAVKLDQAFRDAKLDTDTLLLRLLQDPVARMPDG